MEQTDKKKQFDKKKTIPNGTKRASACVDFNAKIFIDSSSLSVLRLIISHLSSWLFLLNDFNKDLVIAVSKDCSLGNNGIPI